MLGTHVITFGPGQGFWVECSFWEFGAVVRQEKQRHDAGFVSTVEARRKFDIPEFLTAHSGGVEPPADPQTTLVEATDNARAKGWIERDGRLNDQWYEVVSTLVYGRSLAFLYVSAPDAEETRAMVAASRGLAFRFVLHRDRVWIDEVRPDAVEQALVGCLPDVAPAAGAGVRVPTTVLQAAGVEAESHQADQGDWIAYELGQAGVPAGDAKTVGRLSKLADRTTGHFNVAVRDDDGISHVAPWAITTHHSPSGRVAQIPQPPRGEQTLVAPGRPETIADALRGYLGELRLQLADVRRPPRS